MKKLGIVISDGVGYRNYIMSNFISEASATFDTIYIYSGLPASAYENLPSNVVVRELDVFVENKLTWFFRKWKEVTHLQRGRAYYGMMDNKKMNYPNNSPTGLLIKLIYFVSYFHSSNQSILLAEKLQFLSFARNKVTKTYIRLLQEDKPDTVFFTHQRPPYLAPFLYAALKLKITCATFIFSWDNLASKGRMLGTFKYFLVWSELMKRELLTFYPNVKPANIHVVGTPQFEPYVMSRYSSTREDFYLRFQLDPGKKTICFSCADDTIGKNDPLVIQTISDAIRDGKIGAEVQLLVRTSPAEDGKRFVPLVDAYPEIKWNNPEWLQMRSDHAEVWSQRIPGEDDIRNLRSILEYADISVNMCSTMSLDFMIFDKPVVNTVLGNPENGLYDDQRFLKYVHYKNVIDSGAVMIAKNSEELIAALNDSLSDPARRTVERKMLLDMQIGCPLEGTSKRIAEILSRL